MRHVCQARSQASLPNGVSVSIRIRNVRLVYYCSAYSNLCSPVLVNNVPVKAVTAFEQHIMEEIKQLRARVAELEQTVPKSMIGSTSRDRGSIACSEESHGAHAGAVETGEEGITPWRNASPVGAIVGDRRPGLSGARTGPIPVPVDTGNVEDAGESLLWALRVAFLSNPLAATTLEFFALGLDRRVGSESVDLSRKRKRNAQRGDANVSHLLGSTL